MSIRSKLTILFLTIALIPLFLISAFTFNQYKNSLESLSISHMESIAAFKAEKIENYVSALKTYAQIIQNKNIVKEYFPVLVKFAADPSNPEFVSAKKILDDTLNEDALILGLTDIMMVNPQGKIVYSSNPGHYANDFLNNLPDPQQKAFLGGKDKIYLSDVFFDKVEQNKQTILVTFPGFDIHADFIGVIALEADMEPIYKLIQDTTSLGNTGETLLGKKIGDEVVYLNPLRHEPQAKSNKKIKIGQAIGIPIQNAVQGKTGSGQGLDYRGKNVIAAWRNIPLLNFGIVAKIDMQEAFADVFNLRNLIIGILLIIAIICGIVAFYIANYISRPIRKLVKGAQIVGGGNLEYRVANNSNDEIGQFSRIFDEMVENLKIITVSRDELNKESIERKKAEEQLQRINRTLQARSHIDRSAIIAESEVDFLKEACQIIVNDCGYSLVWIGFAEDDKLKTVWPVASSGFDNGYIESLAVSWADNELGRGPTGTAIRTGKPCACTNMLTDPQFKPWRQEAIKRGYASSFVIPLLYKDQVFGAVSIYFKQSGSLSEEEAKLLIELVDDLAHGIFTIRLRQAHLRTIVALRESEGRYKGIVFSSPEAIFVQSSGRIRFANPAAIEMFKASDQSDLINRPVLSVVVKEFHKLAKQYIRNASVEQPAEVEMQLMRRDGVIFDASITGRGITYAGKLAVQIIVRDITVIKKSQEVLKRDKELLEKLVGQKVQELLVAQRKIEQGERLADIGTLSATVAHELRNPLAAMRMAAYNIRRKAQNPELEKNLDNIETKIKDSEQIINNLLFYARLKMPKFEAVSIFDILMESIVNLQSGYPKNNIKIKQDFDSLKNLTVEADPLQLSELFVNILNNACEAVDNEKGEIEVKGIRDENYVKLTIQDNGIGINPEDLKNVFEPFFSTKAKGTGLGLAVCHQIVSLHNGSIDIQNKENKGVVVSIVLPLKREKNE